MSTSAAASLSERHRSLQFVRAARFETKLALASLTVISVHVVDDKGRSALGALTLRCRSAKVLLPSPCGPSGS